MSHTDILFRDRRVAAGQPRLGAIERIVRFVFGFVRRHGESRPTAGMLSMETGRDIGARHDVLDYAPVADLTGGSHHHLHRIAETVRWTSPPCDRI